MFIDAATMAGDNGSIGAIYGYSSVLITAMDGNGNIASSQEYKPWGEVRSGAVPQTDLNYTGQRKDGTGLLYYNARYYDPMLARFISADTIVPGMAMGAGGALGSVGTDSASSAKGLTVAYQETSFAAAAAVENRFTFANGFYFQLSSRDRQQAKAPYGPLYPQALNRYSYAVNNPLRYVDPTGHCPFCPFFFVIWLGGIGTYNILCSSNCNAVDAVLSGLAAAGIAAVAVFSAAALSATSLATATSAATAFFGNNAKLILYNVSDKVIIRSTNLTHMMRNGRWGSVFNISGDNFQDLAKIFGIAMQNIVRAEQIGVENGYPIFKYTATVGGQLITIIGAKVGDVFIITGGYPGTRLRRIHMLKLKGLVCELVSVNQLRHNAATIDVITRCLKLIDEYGSSPYLLVLLADSYFRLLDFEQSVMWMEKAVQVSPNDANLYGKLAQYYALINDYKKATSSYRKALSINPNSAWMLVSAASMYDMSDDEEVSIEEAISWVEQAIVINSEIAWYHARLGHLYLKVGRTSEAEEAFCRAMLCSEGPIDIEQAASIYRLICSLSKGGLT